MGNTIYMYYYLYTYDPQANLNTLRLRRNEQHFADDIFKGIFFNENVWIAIKISLKFVPKGPINNTPALVQIMAWRRSGDKPLSEPMMVSLPTHICVTRPQWVNKSGTETGIFHDNKVITMAAVALAPSIACGCFKNAYELLNLRALKISLLCKNHIFQCMGSVPNYCPSVSPKQTNLEEDWELF